MQNYYRRFAGLTLGVGTMSGSYSNEFYSFDSGLVHFVFINTEVYGDEAFATLQADGKTWKADEAARAAVAAAQVDWLTYDLSRVKRSETPYVIVCGHRPPFKTPGPLSSPGNKFAKEIIPLMSKYQVDLYLAGHEHTYLMFEASTFKDFNVPPIIISGSPGNNEYIRTEAELNIKGFTYKTHIPKYGFGYLTATKESLKWQWGTAATDASHKPSPAMWTMADELTIPRRTTFAAVTPEGKPVKTPGDLSTVWTSAKNGASLLHCSLVHVRTVATDAHRLVLGLCACVGCRNGRQRRSRRRRRCWRSKRQEQLVQVRLGDDCAAEQRHVDASVRACGCSSDARCAAVGCVGITR